MGALEIGVIALIYVALLFLLGRWAERYRRLTLARWLPLMYGLSFAVYCSSWSFLGAVGQASQQPWSFLPIFLAPILLFSFGFGLLRRVVQAAKQQNITSVADFIASRYGKSQGLAAVVTLIAMLGLMPYMALQLNAMVLAFTALAPAPLVTLDHTGPITQMLNSERSLALLLALILALLAMLFGTRKLDSSEHNPGMTVAVAFDAIMKLAIFLVVGGVVLAYAGGPSALWMQLQAQPEQPSYQLDLLDIAPATCLAMAAFLALPRMFHVLVVENQQVEDLCRNRWTFPVYLLLFMSMVVPLSVAGLVFLPANISVDIMVIALPQQLELKGLTALAMLGALSAATSMVVVGAVAMAIMISNEWVIPLLLRSHRIKSNNFAQLQQRLLNLRRVIILLMLLGAYGAYWLFGSSVSLSHIGLFAFGAFAQLAPAIVGAVYWRRGHRYGVFAGLLIGLLGWLFVAAPHITLLEHSWHWFGYETDASRLLLVLLANMLGYVLVSLLAIPSVTDRVQANVFTQGNAIQGARRQGQITEQDLLLLVGRFISPERVQHSFAEQFAAPPRMIQRHASEDMILCGERLIASVLGASSAATIMDTVLRGIDLGIDQMFQLVDDASNQIQSSQDQMRGAIEHAAEGISVVDKELNMVAWNQTYVQLFEYPEGFLTQGMPVAEVIRYNANLGRCGPGDVDAHVARRVGYMQAGSAHRSERIRSDGRVIRMLGNPMPDGGFVMSFSDITEFRQQQQALTEINDTLEQRVAARTEELLKLNQRLRQAKAAEEQANQSKGRFLAAVGHDLMQPLNAARLFTASLLQAPERTDEDHTTLTHLAGSLRNAGEMLSDLLDISKLDGQHLAVDRQTVRLSLVLEPLAVEFSAMAASKGLQWRCHIPDVAIETDANLLRRIVQNFLTNALRYTEQGRILLGCRRRGYQLEIQVFDSGNGIAKADSERIFDEFQQLADRSASGGLGLGLAIAKRIATMLAHPLRLQSQLGKGSMFSVTVPLGTALMPQAEPIKLMPNWQPLAGVRVLCIDNDRSILIALQGLLNGWHCEVLAVPSLAVAQVHLAEDDWRPQIVLADYHLDDNKTGLDALLALREGYGDNLPGILMTADTRTELIEQVEQLGFGFMAKMVKPAGLKALMSALLRQQRLPQQQAELMPMN